MQDLSGVNKMHFPIILIGFIKKRIIFRVGVSTDVGFLQPIISKVAFYSSYSVNKAFDLIL